MPELDTLLRSLISATVFAVLGIVIFVITVVLIDRFSPGEMWKEIVHDNNTALAILMAGFAIGISIIIAAAVH
ncbi:MAG TPA: DUF350 domain-containing protein [Gemmatimonadaceae bacterium]|jgi:putative membrane protein|nr:DUF350 domain-containing protein [Gemmatimonadaceae bacterium]